MIVQYIGKPIKHIKCVAMFDDSLCISSENNYMKLYYYEPTENPLPYIKCYLRVCFGIKGVSDMLLRKLKGKPCTFREYIDGELHITMQCWFVEFEKELSGFNEGGYRLEFQIV